ncbi:hypothetical protein A3850_015950 [Lewinella sp. 4G2]|nr:hypothetical protein A3850_015950 [Lewinella sp. 4G2]
MPLQLASLLPVVAGLCFLGTNQLYLFDWDELNFAEVSREMSRSGNFLAPQINYAPFHEKPPLFFWMQAFCTKIFGASPRGARFPNLIAGVITIILLARWGRRARPKGSESWPWLLGGSLLPLLYFQSGIIDPWYNLFILLGLWPSHRGQPSGWRAICQGGLFLGLAVLTKGPVALLIAALLWSVLLVSQPQDRPRRLLAYGAAGLLALLPMAIWVGLVWQQDGGVFAREFITYQWRLFLREDAGHGGFPGYHVIVLLLGCFPAAWLALPALFRRQVFASATDRGMRALFWIVLILFSIVNTKIVHYSSLCYFPLAWFAARALGEGILIKGWRRAVATGLLGTWLLYTIIAIAVPTLGQTVPQWIHFVEDAELVSRLELNVEWPWYTFLPAIVGVAGIVAWWVLGRRAGPNTAAARSRLLGTRGSALLFLTPLLLLTSLYTIVPRVQTYSQGAPTQFFRQLAGRDVYVGTAYYKSYAHYYFAELPPDRYAEGCQERQCRFHEKITKPLFFASPLRVTEQVLREVPDAILLRSEGGFSFYVREP